MGRVWSNGEIHLVQWPDGAVCRYREEHLDYWYDGGDPVRREVLWDALRDREPGGAEGWSGWRLVPSEAGHRLEGPGLERIHTVRLDLGDTPAGPFDLRALSPRARLEGTAVVDPEQGLVLDLHAGYGVRIEGAGPRTDVWLGHSGRGRRIWVNGPERAFVVDLAYSGRPGAPTALPGRLFGPPTRRGVLLQIGESVVRCTVESMPDTFAHTREGTVETGDVIAVAMAAESWLLHRGDAVEILRSGGASQWLAPPTEATWEAWPPDPRVVAEGPLEATVPPGPFTAGTRIRSIGRKLAGLVLKAGDLGDVRITAAHLHGVEARPDANGEIRFPHAPLSAGRPLALAVEGTVVASAEASIPLFVATYEPIAVETTGPVAAPRRHTAEVGALHLVVTVEDAGLVLVRGDTRLALHPDWVAALREAGALDLDATPPDLDRWVRRALARCRVQAVSDDPQGVLAEWLRMTERDREASGPKLPAYKLATGKHWVVTAPEAATIRAALGADHPLGAFATGPLVVEGPDPLATP
ncbi:MAG: hypothetical protein H6737_30530 [Alphaproteobacteria bacterium]|nr:hypothetical protein [Alphaproteobacteria bacterium]